MGSLDLPPNYNKRSTSLELIAPNRNDCHLSPQEELGLGKAYQRRPFIDSEHDKTQSQTPL